VGIETVLEQTRLFVSRLQTARLTVDRVLYAADLITATRTRSDPSTLERLSLLRRSLAAAAGDGAPSFGPMTVVEELGQVAVDGALHRSWWVARWPRREVPACWLDQLLYGVNCTRTLTVVFEPVTPSRSDRDLDREIVNRETTMDAKAKRGFRISGKERTAAAAVSQREQELNSGYAELAYAGLVTISSISRDTLDRNAAAVENVAAESGVELQPLFGRQAEGWVSSLPLGRTIAARASL
jgi:hypothetical protein